MKVEINKNVLEHMLVNCQNFLDKKDSSSITSHVLLVSEDGNFKIKATDYEIGIFMQTSNYKAIHDGKASANGKKILDMVKVLKDDDVTLEVIEDNLIISQKDTNYKLSMFNTEEYPEFPTTENKSKFEINPMDFLHSIKKISPAIDSNNPKYELNGALIDLKENRVNFVGTDTKRLALVTLEESIESDISLIIPKKAIGEIQKLFFDEMKIFYDENIMIIESENFTFFTKLINGKYPDYERIIPQNTNYQLTINKEKMVEHLRQISIVSNEMKITFNNDSILFESLSEDSGEGKTKLDYICNLPESIYINVNSRYILDFLANIDESEFTLEYNDSTLPFLLTSNNFKTIVMPIIR
jgi:DNA polymerase-3 subunit beta